GERKRARKGSANRQSLPEPVQIRSLIAGVVREILGDHSNRMNCKVDTKHTATLCRSAPAKSIASFPIAAATRFLALGMASRNPTRR
ncbi:MAG: hypothetical protein KDA55_13400, partial [Planctomycetales bacterium]|nr:hypothetical protein [Planctomycetales bacterium]